MPGLKKIAVDTNNNNAIDFRVLACVIEKNNLCVKYSNPNANNILCNEEKLAHIYYREQSSNVSVKHYLLVFISASANRTDVIKSLDNSIKLLGINTNVEKTFFNMVFYDCFGMVHILIKEYEEKLKYFNCCGFRFHSFYKSHSYLTLYDPNKPGIEPLNLK
ncbi:MAG: hypothetical protein FWF67_05725 [Fibromonadales bacterium]|nr:hypothetical protein [Fibromonadales bacterium]